MKSTFLSSLLLSLLYVSNAVALPGNATDVESIAGIPPVITKCTKPNTVALTFDDGPYHYLESIAKTLNDAGAKGTFFWNGDNFGCIYDYHKQIKKVFEQGHQVASHAWKHDDLAKKSEKQLNDLLGRMEVALERMVGVTPAFMRPPFGSYNERLRKVAHERGQTIANWDYDTHDADEPPPSSSKRLEKYKKLIEKDHPPTILTLNHEFNRDTAEVVLPQVVKWLADAGYKMVTVAECLGMEPYQRSMAPQQPNSSWKC